MLKDNNIKNNIIMKRNLLIAVALVATMTVMAQNIAVVSSSNETKIYQTLDEAITKATAGSTIYLPGGGFQISDDTKIDKKLTIMGVSHRWDTDNADGATFISGNLNFIGGSSGSAVMGVYISGNINVGTSEDAVENFTMKKCSANSIQVSNSASSGMVVNQCYLRSGSKFGNCNVRLENNILHSAFDINCGYVNHNIIVSYNFGYFYSGCGEVALIVKNSSIMNNFILERSISGENSYINRNCFKGSGYSGVDETPITLDDGKTWGDIFRSHKGVSMASDYRLKDGVDKSKFKGTDGTTIGIEGGSGFDPDALAPIPRIVSKKVDEQSDASGKLTINVTVKSK